MIRFTTGDILAEDAEALVNTVNCVGVMGRGVALGFKKAFPENFRAYANACAHGEVRPGRMFVFETGPFTNHRYIINFPTKRHWRDNSRIEDIDAGLKDLATVIRERGIRSIAIPALGSGLEWSDVRPRIEKALGECNDLNAVVFEPQGAPEARRMTLSSICEAPKMTPGRAALIGLMDRYLYALLDPFVTLLEVHKLMYFMQVAGQRLRLCYTKGSYGPYAKNLRNVLTAMEGHFIAGYGDDRDDRPDKHLELVPGAVEQATKVLGRSPKTRERFDRVADLVYGFESAFGLELLSTVHWILEHEAPASRDELVALTYAWSDHKKRFLPGQLELAADVLRDKGWTDESFAISRL